MRKTILHRTTVAVVGVLIIVVIALGILRNTLISHSEGEERGNERMEHHAEMSQAASKEVPLFRTKGCPQCHTTESREAGMAWV